MNSRALQCLTATAALAIMQTAALAADETHGGHEAVGALPTVKQGAITGITAIVVFVIVAAILGAFVWPKIAGALDERANKIRSEIESAEFARKQAKDALEQYQKSLADARAEAQKMLEDTKAQQARLAADLKAKADTELGAMRERAMRDIEAAKRAAVGEIYNDASNLATMIAGKILRRQISDNDQQQLVEESLAQLQAMKN